MQALICNRNDILEMKENILPSVAVLCDNLLKQSGKCLANTTNERAVIDERIVVVNETQQRREIAGGACSLTPPPSTFETYSSVFCLLIFVSVNLLLYVYPIPY